MARRAALHQALRARARELRQEIIEHFIIDFCCLPAALVVEIDGPIHDKQAEQDAERDRNLAARGIRVLRFSNEQIMTDIYSCLARIREAALPRP